jgi:hypothetical protein
MKKSLYVILPLIGFCLSYLLVAFVKADMNFINWNEGTRFVAVLWGFMGGFGFSFVADVIND